MKRHPKCYGCNGGSAKLLNLPGAYGQIEMYCSLRCAARDAIQRGLAGAVEWSPKKRKWVDEAEQEDDEEAG
jgi:hypothetical protein